MYYVKHLSLLSLIAIASLNGMSEEPAFKKQRVSSSEDEVKLKAAAQHALTKPQEMGIQDTLASFIRRDPTTIVKAYLGWDKQSYGILKSSTCLAFGRDEQDKPLVYIGNPIYVNIFCPAEKRILEKILVAEPYLYTSVVDSIFPLAAGKFIAKSLSSIRLFNRDHEEDLSRVNIDTPGSLAQNRFLSMSVGTNNIGIPTLLIRRYGVSMGRVIKAFLRGSDLLLPKINRQTENIFVLETDEQETASCIGKAKNGDCLGYYIYDNGVAVFNLESGMLKKQFPYDPKLKSKLNGVLCSANDEGHVAIGALECVYIYDENGTLIKEIPFPFLGSVDLTNKGRCILGDTKKGLLRSFSIASDEVHDIGTCSFEKRHWYPILDTKNVTVDRNKPTRVAALNEQGALTIWTDEAEAIEAYDRELKERRS
ncbi:MAG: hypothetical protein ACHQVS_02980 [Candidatus Babeliales bacterium]